MNPLFKLRPGLFGLLMAAIAVSTFSTALTKTPRTTTAPTQVSQASVMAAPEQPGAAQEQAIEPATTYLQYQVDTDLSNLETLVKNRAANLLEQGFDSQKLNDRLWDLNQVWEGSPDQVVERVAIVRAMQTLVDGEQPPTPGELVNPTLEGYQSEHQ